MWIKHPDRQHCWLYMNPVTGGMLCAVQGKSDGSWDMTAQVDGKLVTKRLRDVSTEKEAKEAADEIIIGAAMARHERETAMLRKGLMQ